MKKPIFLYNGKNYTLFNGSWAPYEKLTYTFQWAAPKKKAGGGPPPPPVGTFRIHRAAFLNNSGDPNSKFVEYVATGTWIDAGKFLPCGVTAEESDPNFSPVNYAKYVAQLPEVYDECTDEKFEELSKYFNKTWMKIAGKSCWNDGQQFRCAMLR